MRTIEFKMWHAAIIIPIALIASVLGWSLFFSMARADGGRQIADRVNSAFTKVTTADVTFTNTDVLADITGLSVTVLSGKTYRFKVLLPITITGGTVSEASATLQGTATITSMWYTMSIWDDDTGTLQERYNYYSGYQQINAVNNQSGYLFAFEGVVTVNVGGTFKVQGAQNTATVGETTTFKRGCLLYVEELQ